MFAFVPDALLRIRFGGMATIIWLMCAIYFTIVPPIYSIIALVSSLTEKYMTLRRFRLMLYLIFCTIGMLCNMLMCMNINVGMTRSFRHYGFNLLNGISFFLLVFSLLFVYSTRRIIDDYNFTYGVSPQEFWIVCWKFAPITALVSI